MRQSRPRPPASIPESLDLERTLAFVNTLSARPTPAPVERLTSYAALLDWAREAGLLTADDVDRLSGRARRRADDAARILERARHLRERLNDTFTATSAGRLPAAAVLEALSDALSQWYTHARLVADGDRLQWAAVSGDDLARPLWEIARAAARLVTSPRLMRVRACAADDCGWWFLDETKNHSRRWCDMKICGNRDKVRRFRARSAE